MIAWHYQPYIIIALVLVILGLMIRYPHLSDIKEEDAAIDHALPDSKKGIFYFPYFSRDYNNHFNHERVFLA